MPLITSPIDGSPMREIQRYGVKIDICPTSGGIWLDRGELEKIILMIRKEALEESVAEAGYAAPAYEEAEPYAPQHAPREKRSRKRDSIFENLLDLFD